MVCRNGYRVPEQFDPSFGKGVFLYSSQNVGGYSYWSSCGKVHCQIKMDLVYVSIRTYTSQGMIHM